MKKYPFFKTLKRSIYEVWKSEKFLFILFIIHTIIASVIPILSIYMPRLILVEVQKRNSHNKFTNVSVVLH